MESTVLSTIKSEVAKLHGTIPGTDRATVVTLNFHMHNRDTISVSQYVKDGVAVFVKDPIEENGAIVTAKPNKVDSHTEGRKAISVTTFERVVIDIEKNAYVTCTAQLVEETPLPDHEQEPEA